jgi:hypothetical protein
MTLSCSMRGETRSEWWIACARCAAIHSMLGEIGASGELAMLSRRKTCADAIKHPATPCDPETKRQSRALPDFFK